MKEFEEEIIGYNIIIRIILQEKKIMEFEETIFFKPYRFYQYNVKIKCGYGT